MGSRDLIPILPFIIIAFTAVLVMLMTALKQGRAATFIITLCGYAFSLVSTCLIIPEIRPAHQITPLLIIDGYSLFFIDLIVAASLALAILSYDYLKMHAARSGEYYVLFLTATLGGMVLTASSHFMSFFLGLEILSLSLYVLVAYLYTTPRHLEAGIKYLVLSSVSTAFLLFGMALIYYRAGTMEFSVLGTRMPGLSADPALVAGTVMVTVGIGFKLALVPFHMWAPDVFEGAPVPVAAFIATVSKGAVFTVLVRFFTETVISGGGPLFIIFSIIAATTMFTGNFLALFQNNVKRLLAYSSIAQFGYLLVAFLSARSMRTTSIAFYLTAYFVMSIGAFGIVTLMADKDSDADPLHTYAGLFFARPWFAAAFALMLLGLAGMPLTIGLIGKLYIFAAGVSSGLTFLVIVLAVNSVVGLFYYIRVISIMFIRPEAGEIQLSKSRFSMTGRLLIAALSVILVWLGIYPAPLVGIIQKMIGP